MLWDTAGQEEFDAITKAYYRGAQACVVAFSTTDRASFDAVVRWKNKVRNLTYLKQCGQTRICTANGEKPSNGKIDDLTRLCLAAA